jgi:predicted nucleic acid-binding protein
VTTIAYIDASALVKLVVTEPETAEMERWFVENDRILTSLIGVIETRRAVARRPHDPVHLEQVIGRIEVLGVNRRLGDTAAAIRPWEIRTLDAIHLATAMSIRPDLDAFVTYDDRLAAAARDLGLRVVSPA